MDELSTIVIECVADELKKRVDVIDIQPVKYQSCDKLFVGACFIYRDCNLEKSVNLFVVNQNYIVIESYSVHEYKYDIADPDFAERLARLVLTLSVVWSGS